jgi:hypothetical protein
VFAGLSGSFLQDQPVGANNLRRWQAVNNCTHVVHGGVAGLPVAAVRGDAGKETVGDPTVVLRNWP